MIGDKRPNFNLISARWYISERNVDARGTTVRTMSIDRDELDVIFRKDGEQILRMSVEQWEELKRII